MDITLTVIYKENPSRNETTNGKILIFYGNFSCILILTKVLSDQEETGNSFFFVIKLVVDVT